MVFSHLNYLNIVVKLGRGYLPPCNTCNCKFVSPITDLYPILFERVVSFFSRKDQINSLKTVVIFFMLWGFFYRSFLSGDISVLTNTIYCVVHLFLHDRKVGLGKSVVFY